MGHDYDTLVRLDRETWHVTGAVRLQEAADGTAMFVGDLWMPPSEDLVVVPRPGSGDVAIVDPTDLHMLQRIEVGSQPLVAVIADDRIVARDWKTGDTLIGSVA